jgi:hypothetical protein
MDSNLSPEQKLALLQTLDTRRKWHSLDDQRVCVLCDRAITGRAIRFIRDRAGGFAVHCPTEGCPSVPGDWFYHGNGISTAKAPAHRMGEMSFWEQ